VAGETLTIQFPIINLGSEEEPDLWAIIEAHWQPHKSRGGLVLPDDLPADEYLWTLYLRRAGEEKFLRDQRQADVQSWTDPEQNPYQTFVMEE
jgi:hypothetical protein